MNAVIVTIDDRTGSERLGNWLEVTELLSDRVGIPTQGSGLVPTFVLWAEPWTRVLGKYIHLINRKSLNISFFFFLY